MCGVRTPSERWARACVWRGGLRVRRMLCASESEWAPTLRCSGSGVGDREWEVGGAGGEESGGCEGPRDRSCSHVVRDVACTEVYACTGPSLVVAWLVSALHCTVVKSKTGSLQKFTGIEPADASRSQCSTLKHRLHAELWELCTRVHGRSDGAPLSGPRDTSHRRQIFLSHRA